jgi:hypothetical protein
MAFPVTTAGTFTCAHQGVRVLTSAEPKLTVDGKAVLFFTEAAPAPPVTYLGCTFPQGAPPTPCRTTSAPEPNQGAAKRLTVGGAPVLLDALRATTENPPFAPPPDPAKTVTVAAGQEKLTAS